MESIRHQTPAVTHGALDHRPPTDNSDNDTSSDSDEAGRDVRYSHNVANVLLSAARSSVPHMVEDSTRVQARRRGGRTRPAAVRRGQSSIPRRTPMSSTRRVPASSRPYRQRMSTQEKLSRVYCVLRDDCHWTIQEFLTAWISDENIEGCGNCRQGSWRREAMREIAQDEGFRARCGISSEAVDLTTIKIELLALVEQQPVFGRYVPGTSIESLDFEHAFQTIQDSAPVWHHLITSLLYNKRARRESYPAQAARGLPQQVFMITAFICHAQSKKSSSFFQTLLSVYLHGSGVKRRVLDTLHGLGICHSYNTINRRMEMVATEAKIKQQLPVLSRDQQAVIVYDNMNFKENTRHEILGHSAGMRAVTTASIVICPQLPSSGLKQSMHHPENPLRIDDIFDGLSHQGDDTGVQISQFLIANAIRSVHPDGVARIFENTTQYPQMPVLHQIPPQKTKFWQFGGIFEDEGTISGTYRVHDSIFITQLGLRAPQKPSGPRNDFSKRLWLVHGDQLTAQRIRSVKTEQQSAERPYDRRDWMLGLPAWFHIQMNLLYTIVRTHWTGFNGLHQSRHCLKADSTAWGRTQHGPENIKYHLVAPIVVQAFASRVTAMFYSHLERRGLIEMTSATVPEFMGDMDDIVARLPPALFGEIIEEIRLQAFTLEAWEGTHHKDIEFRSMCRMLQEVELFLVVQYALKRGDVGHLRRIVDPLIIVFFGAGQQNYGREMLFYRWNLLSSVNTDELQYAILASGLVNWTGRRNAFKAIDLGLEHLNGHCKTEMTCYMNSTKDIDLIFNRVCLSNTFVREVRTKLEATFGKHMPGEHTVMDAELDMFSLARNLHGSHLAAPRDKGHPEQPFDSPNIFQRGVDVLEDRIRDFNSIHVRDGDTTNADVESSVDMTDDTFVDIDDFFNLDNADSETPDLIDLTNGFD